MIMRRCLTVIAAIMALFAGGVARVAASDKAMPLPVNAALLDDVRQIGRAHV